MIAVGKEVERKEAGDLLSEVGSRASGGCSDAGGRGGDAEDSTALASDNVEGGMGETKMEMPPRARSEGAQRGGSRNGRSHLGLVPYIQSKVARLLHTHKGKYLRRHLREQEGCAAKRAYVCITGVAEKGRYGVPGEPEAYTL